MTPKYLDGYIPPAGRLVSITPVIRRPFRNRPIPDIATKLYDYDYDIPPDGRYTPRIAVRTLGAPDTAPADAAAYLILESDPAKENSARGRVTRTFGNIPPDQIRYDAVNYSRPAVPGTGANRNYGAEVTGNAGMFYQPDTAQQFFHAYSRRAVATDQGVANSPTGGTWSLAFGANTSSGMAYNITNATLKTDLDGLTSVTNYGGLASLTGVYTDAAGFIATFNNFSAATLTTSSLTGYSDSSTSSNVATANNGWTQNISIQRYGDTITPLWSVDTTSLTATTGAIIGSLFTSPAPGGGAIFIEAIDNASPSIDITSITNCAVTKSGYFTQPFAGASYSGHLQINISGLGYVSQPQAAGTFTITAFGQTTAGIAVNALDAAALKTNIETALSALTNLAARGTLSVTIDTYSSIYGGAAATQLAIVATISVGASITGGTYTITAFGQTTGSIAYNAGRSTIEAALNTLSNVQARGSIALIGPGWIPGFGVSFNYSFPTARFTGGTYTATIFGQTTAGIPAAATLTDIAAAFNALSEVTNRGGAVVTGVGLSADGATISYTLTFSASAMVGVSSLTGAPSAVTVAIVAGTNGRQQTIKLTAAQVVRLLTCTNPHGLAPGETIYLKMGSYYMARTDWTYVSANQISLNPAAAPWSTNTTITELGRYQRTYAPTPAEHQSRITSKFWLPGVSGQPATIADIPLPPSPISDTVYLNAVVSPDAYVPYASGNLGAWMESVILTRDQTEILLPP